jgi:ATP-dependent protease ClpP protease subunit
MKKFFAFMLMFSMLFVGCAGVQDIPVREPVQAEVKITVVQEGDAVAIKAETPGEKPKVLRSMEVRNPGLALSQLSAISNGKLFIKIFSGLSVADVTRFWNDLIYIENETDIMDVEMFIDSPGGDAFSGLALADMIEKYRAKGFHFTAHATGIIASAAVPVFSVCDERRATEATIFMVHEAALWKWPGRETASDIRTQGKLMDLLQLLYLTKMVENSNLNFDQWVALEKATSWFGVQTFNNGTGDVMGAMEIGILDFIDDRPSARKR